MLRRLAPLLLLLCLTVPVTGQVDNATVAEWCDRFDASKNLASSNGSYARHQRWRVADDILKMVNAEALTGTQIAMLLDRGVLEWSRKRPIYRERLETLASASTPAGATAAMNAVRLFDGRMDPAARAALVRRAFEHPNVGDTIHQAATWEVASLLREEEDETLQAGADALLAGVGTLRPARVRPEHAGAFPAMQEVLVRALGPERASESDGVRRAMVSQLETVLAGAPTRVRPKIQEALDRMNGAYLRGELIGHPAPPMEFLWTNHEASIERLSDLKGTVVVLDFWATWCSPCIASIPDVQDLQSRYEGYDVVILGVTSVQGYHMSFADGTRRRPTRIDTRGNPEREFELMRSFVQEKEITWPVVFSAASVYDPDFYVRGIPHVVIIDAAGVVRHRDLHPMERFSPKPSKADRIDALLREAGLRVPGDDEGAP